MLQNADFNVGIVGETAESRRLFYLCFSLREFEYPNPIVLYDSEVAW